VVKSDSPITHLQLRQLSLNNFELISKLRKANMATEEKSNTQKQGDELTSGAILTGALYIATVLFVLGFLWQSIASFLLAK
jgi:hypothetical protein